MMLGDLLVAGEPSAKLTKALAVIASTLHPVLDTTVIPGKSKESCVLASLTVRDFLWRIGFKEAKAVACYRTIRAVKDGEELHSLGVGDHAAVGQPIVPEETRGRWNGHLVVTVAGMLIDATLYPAKRPQWPELPGMVAVPTAPPSEPGDVIAAGGAKQDDGSLLELAWFYQPTEGWRQSPDAVHRERRAPVVKALVNAFGRALR